MNNDKIKTIFEQAAQIVEGLPEVLKPKAFEIAVSQLGLDSKPNAVIGVEKTKTLRKFPTNDKSRKRKAFGLKDYISELIENGYFDSAKTLQSISEDFKKRARTDTRSAISMTLMLLVRKDILERNGQGTHKDPWSYQKAK